MKDLDHDREGGARTFAVVTGSVWKKEEITLSPLFLGWGIVRGATFALGVSVFSYVIVDAEGWDETFSLVAIVGAVALFAHSLTFLRGSLKTERKPLIRRFAVHEITAYSLMIVMILPMIGPVMGIVLMIAPILWFILFNGIIYRTGITPGV